MKRVASLACLLALPVIASLLLAAGLCVSTAAGQSRSSADPPVQATLSCPVYSTDAATGRGIAVSWQASGAAGYYVEVKSGLTGAWSPLLPGVTSTTSTTDSVGGSGTYFFRARGTSDGGQGVWSVVHATVVPTDDAASQVHYRGAWRRTSGPRGAAFLKTLHSATKAGATASFSFKGRSIALICVTGPRHGKAAVYLDGSSRAAATVDTDSRATKSRRVVYSKTWATPATHTITLKVLGTKGRATVAFDAVAAGELDSAAPTGDFSFSGDGVQTVAGRAYATASAISLDLRATDDVAVAGVEASADRDFAGAAWAPFAGPLDFQLSGPDGLKSVSVRYRDDAGHVSPSVTSTVTLDTTEPPLSVSPGDTRAVAGQDLAVTADASDVTSGLASVKLYYGVAGSSGFSEADFAADPGGGYVAAIPGGAIAESPLRYYVVATDVAGNATARPLGAPVTLYAVTPHSATAPGDITGTVRDPSQAGLGGIDVTSYQADGTGGWNAVSDVYTESDGTYDLTGLAPAAYRLEFFDDSGAHLTQCYDNQPSLAGAADVTVAAAATTSGVDVTLARAGDIAGTVTDVSRAGLAGIEVTANQADGLGGWNYVSGVQTKADGTYDLSGLAGGTYRVGFDDLSGTYLMQCYDAAVGLDWAADVVVTTGGTIFGVDATLGRAGDIIGTVTDPSHTGLAGIDVTAYQADGSGGWNAVSEVYTGSDGTYDLNGLGTADYRLEFSDGSGNHVAQCYEDAADLGSATDIAVTVGATTCGVDATLADAVGGTFRAGLDGTR